MEKPKFNHDNNKNLDFSDAQVCEEVLVQGSDEELEALRKFHNISSKKIEYFRYYARLRKNVHDEQWKLYQCRLNENPKATEQELEMGIYLDFIEPQVKEAVINLRKKGYSTYESGFYGGSEQRISFDESPLGKFKFSASLYKNLLKQGVVLNHDDKSIWFESNKELQLDTIKNIWDIIIKEVPDLGEPAKPCQLPQAKHFREKQLEYK